MGIGDACREADSFYIGPIQDNITASPREVCLRSAASLGIGSGDMYKQYGQRQKHADNELRHHFHEEPRLRVAVLH